MIMLSTLWPEPYPISLLAKMLASAGREPHPKSQPLYLVGLLDGRLVNHINNIEHHIQSAYSSTHVLAFAVGSVSLVKSLNYRIMMVCSMS